MTAHPFTCDIVPNIENVIGTAVDPSTESETRIGGGGLYDNIDAVIVEVIVAGTWVDDGVALVDVEDTSSVVVVGDNEESGVACGYETELHGTETGAGKVTAEVANILLVGDETRKG